jgi:hypothetical protein
MQIGGASVSIKVCGIVMFRAPKVMRSRSRDFAR